MRPSVNHSPAASTPRAGHCASPRGSLYNVSAELAGAGRPLGIAQTEQREVRRASRAVQH